MRAGSRELRHVEMAVDDRYYPEEIVASGTQGVSMPYPRAVVPRATKYALTAGSRCMAVKCVARRSIAILVVAPEKDCEILAS
jgi:hypothetical protein